MKKLIIILSLAIVSNTGKAQTAAAIPQNKTFNLDKPKDEGRLTSNRATLKGETLKVYVTAKGKLFVKLKSEKTGKEYRRYIPVATL